MGDVVIVMVPNQDRRRRAPGHQSTVLLHTPGTSIFRYAYRLGYHNQHHQTLCYCLDHKGREPSILRLTQPTLHPLSSARLRHEVMNTLGLARDH